MKWLVVLVLWFVLGSLSHGQVLQFDKKAVERISEGKSMYLMQIHNLKRNLQLISGTMS